jgi:phosphopantetheinyl transferase
MPLVFQQNINEYTQMAIWETNEPIDFFLKAADATTHINHPERKKAHLAGRFLLKQIYPNLLDEDLLIASTGKPIYKNNSFHYSIAHSGNFVVVIGSNEPVGIDIEFDGEKAASIQSKFMNEHELNLLSETNCLPKKDIPVLVWTIKESAYKWRGEKGIRFREQINLTELTGTGKRISMKLNLLDKAGAINSINAQSLPFKNGWISWITAPHPVHPATDPAHLH